MALNLFGDYDLSRPTHLLDQFFGMGLHPEDHRLAPVSIPHNRHFPHHRLHHTPGYHRSWRLPSADNGSVVKCDKDKFQVNLDVQQFSPEELTVKVVDNWVIVEGKHEEKQDEHGFISRQFQRRYLVPKGHDIQHVVTKLSSDGVLAITAPRIDAKAIQERAIPIIHTGEPHKAVKAASEATEAGSETKEAAKK